MGCDSDALAFLEQSPALSGTSIGLTDSILGGGLMAVARLRLGNPEGARHAAELTVSRIGSSRPMVGYSLDGYVGAAETLLSILADGAPHPAETARSAAAACASLRGFARVFHIARPRAALLTGREHWLRGHRWRAMRAWKKSLREAERLSMPYELGLAHADLGTHLPSSDGSRKTHLDQARDVFTRLGANHDLARLPS